MRGSFVSRENLTGWKLAVHASTLEAGDLFYQALAFDTIAVVHAVHAGLASYITALVALDWYKPCVL